MGMATSREWETDGGAHDGRAPAHAAKEVARPAPTATRSVLSTARWQEWTA
jgi:hypothetical protein